MRGSYGNKAVCMFYIKNASIIRASISPTSFLPTRFFGQFWRHLFLVSNSPDSKISGLQCGIWRVSQLKPRQIPQVLAKIGKKWRGQKGAWVLFPVGDIRTFGPPKRRAQERARIWKKLKFRLGRISRIWLSGVYRGGFWRPRGRQNRALLVISPK